MKIAPDDTEINRNQKKVTKMLHLPRLVKENEMRSEMRITVWLPPSRDVSQVMMYHKNLLILFDGMQLTVRAWGCRRTWRAVVRPHLIAVDTSLRWSNIYMVNG